MNNFHNSASSSGTTPSGATQFPGGVPVDRRWEPMHTLEALFERIDPTYTFQAEDRAAWSTWQAGFRQHLRALLGVDLLLQHFSRDTKGQRLEHTDCGDHLRELWEITIGASVATLCYVLTPKGGSETRYPVLVAAHGHGEGVQPILGLNADGSPRSAEADNRHHEYAIQAVRAGYVVLAPEIGDFGRRQNFSFIAKTADTDGVYFAKNSCYMTALNGAAMGVPAIGLRVWETMCQLDWLLGQHPAAQPGRAGMFGLSGGGALSLYTAAIDERIVAAGVCGYLTRWTRNMFLMPHCLCNLVPGLLRVAEIDDVAALIAPRHLIVECSRTDRIFPIQATGLAIEKLQRVYGLLGADAAFATECFDGAPEYDGHEFRGIELWRHFGKALQTPPCTKRSRMR